MDARALTDGLHAPQVPESVEATHEAITKGDVRYPADGPHVSDEAKDLIRSLLQREPSKRPALADVLAHPWFAAHAPRAA